MRGEPNAVKEGVISRWGFHLLEASSDLQILLNRMIYVGAAFLESASP